MITPQLSQQYHKPDQYWLFLRSFPPGIIIKSWLPYTLPVGNRPKPEQAFAKALSEWGFSQQADDVSWNGFIAGPDRLRFLGMLSRYAALLACIEMHEAETHEAETLGVNAHAKGGHTKDEINNVA